LQNQEYLWRTQWVKLLCKNMSFVPPNCIQKRLARLSTQLRSSVTTEHSIEHYYESVMIQRALKWYIVKHIWLMNL